MAPKRQRQEAPKASVDKKVATKKVKITQQQQQLEGWSVVLTGQFAGSQEELEEQLKSRGAKVTNDVSSKTTHLILGIRGKNNKNDYIAGVGSKKYKDAEERGLLILQERDVHVVLDQGIESDAEEDERKPAMNAKIIDKVFYVLRKEGVGAKVSDARLKRKLCFEYGYRYTDFTSGRIKFKAAMDLAVHDKLLVKEMRSYSFAPESP